MCYILLVLTAYGMVLKSISSIFQSKSKMNMWLVEVINLHQHILVSD